MSESRIFQLSNPGHLLPVDLLSRLRHIFCVKYFTYLLTDGREFHKSYTIYELVLVNVSHDVSTDFD